MMNARDFALVQLDQTKLPGWPARQLRQSGPAPADPRDIGLAEQIRLGVIKNLALLHHLVTHYSSRKRVDPLVSKILAVALYQIRFLDRIPKSAAVDEAVEQARRMGRKHAAGFVNAVLRRAVREPELALPTRDADPLGYATLTLSHPQDLVKRLMAEFDEQTMLDIAEHDNREPPTLVRAYRGVSVDRLSTSGVQITPHEQSEMYVIEKARRVTLAEWAGKGVAQVQDATAAGVVKRLELLPGLDVLDRCAGMGTKSFHIHDELAGSGWIMAIEPSEERIEAIRAMMKKRKIENIAVVQARMLEEISELKRPAFDRILVDAPCSNSGVLARRPEARYAQTEKSFESLAKLQNAILDDSAPYLRPGGLMVYSTCSIWRAENQERIEAFLKRHRDFERMHELVTLPSCTPDPARYHDGGYVCVMRRN